MGLEKKMDFWQKPNPVYNNLKQLTRERDQLIQEQTQIKCQLHAEKSGAWPNPGSIQRMKQRLALINKQKENVVAEIKKIIYNFICHPRKEIILLNESFTPILGRNSKNLRSIFLITSHVTIFYTKITLNDWESRFARSIIFKPPVIPVFVYENGSPTSRINTFIHGGV